MTGLSRIPFSPKAERTIRQLATWMQYVGGIHVLSGLVILALCFSVAGGCIYLMTVSVEVAPLAFAIVLALTTIYALFGVVVLIEAGLLFSAHSTLNEVVENDVADQQYLSETFRKLKIFFFLEVILGSISVLGSLAQIALAIASPMLEPLMRGLENGGLS